MELEKTLKPYRLSGSTETDHAGRDKTYHAKAYPGISVLEERAFFGGTSIRYWM